MPYTKPTRFRYGQSFEQTICVCVCLTERLTYNFYPYFIMMDWNIVHNIVFTRHTIKTIKDRLVKSESKSVINKCDWYELLKIEKNNNRLFTLTVCCELTNTHIEQYLFFFFIQKLTRELESQRGWKQRERKRETKRKRKKERKNKRSKRILQIYYNKFILIENGYRNTAPLCTTLCVTLINPIIIKKKMCF